MHRRTARGNRLGLILVGLLLLIGGLALVAVRVDVFGSAANDQVAYPDDVATFVADNAGWLWPVAAAVAILIGLVFLRWLLVQPRTDTVRRLRIDADGEGDGSGRTTLASSAVTDAVEDDLTDQRGVRRASASLTGPVDDATLWLAVTTDADADLGRLRRHLATDTVPSVRAALEQPELPVQVRVEVSNRSGGREVR